MVKSACKNVTKVYYYKQNLFDWINSKPEKTEKLIDD